MLEVIAAVVFIILLLGVFGTVKDSVNSITGHDKNKRD